MVGKVPPDALEQLVYSRLGIEDSAVVQGPAYGEDTAAIRMGTEEDDTEELLLVNSDPISLAADRIGSLAVTIACNDIAASGGTPRWLTNVCLLPEPAESDGAGDEKLDRITNQLHEAATESGCAVIGGHAEYSAELSRPLVSMTCLGTAERYVPTSGASPGDVIILTGSAGIEGTAVLATDFRDVLTEHGVEGAVLDRAAEWFGEISVVDPAAALTRFATAMHDPTEGGVLCGLVELAIASGVECEIEDVPVRTETETLCTAMDLDPLRILGSGALLVAVPAADEEEALGMLDEQGIPAAGIGRVDSAEGDPRVVLDGEVFTSPVEDGIYKLWE